MVSFVDFKTKKVKSYSSVFLNQDFDDVKQTVYSSLVPLSQSDGSDESNLKYIAEKTIYDSLVPSFSREVEPGKGITDRQWSDAERAQYLRENYSGSYDFLESVKNGDNNLESYDSNSDYESDKEK